MAASSRRRETLPLTVHNTGFLLDRLGADCHPLQFLRELTQNAIEAVVRTGKAGEVLWDVDVAHLELEGVYKLSIIDNGDGMTGEDMVRYLNRLSSSGSEQSVGGNYGVGAKIAAATRNHAGLVYLSWKDGACSMIHLWRDVTTGQYGLRRLACPDGTFAHYAPVEDPAKPSIISKHGTKIVLLGSREDEDTMRAPPGAPSPSRWIAKYLNTRYFRFPGGVTVRAREGWEHPRSDKDRNSLRQVIGQEAYLQQHAASSGTVALAGATAHWWILRDEAALAHNSGIVESSGHVAALYRDELYELTTGRAGRARLQMFGVILGHNQVVIYVEPHGKSRQLTTNTARTQLLLDGDSLPWAEWAAEFREKMPDAIREHIDAIAAGSAASDHLKSIRERLRPIMDLYRVSRYRMVDAGPEAVDDASMDRGGRASERQQQHRDATARSYSGTKGGTAGGVYSLFLKESGPPGQHVSPDRFPKVQWVTVAGKSREPGDIEDRAARYLAEQNLLLVNGDFRVFADMIDRWVQECGPHAGVRDVVTEAVRAWFEQSLVETVLGVQALRTSAEWTEADVERALSEEALTAAVMARYHVHHAVKREIGSKLGKLSAA